MFLDFFNQSKDRLLDHSNTTKNNINSFLSELGSFLNQPKFNSELSKDVYQIDRFINHNERAVLVNYRNNEVYYVHTKDLPSNAKPFDNIKVENGKYIIDADHNSNL